MNIVYGVQGTGNGHLTRGLALIPKLRSQGHNVRVVISGRKKDTLFGVESLEPFETFEGLSFEVKKGKINYIKSFSNLRLLKFFRDVRQFNLENIDLVITDFEPVTAWAAKFNKVNSIGIGHQYAFSYDIPMAGENFITKLILKTFAPANINIGVHWHHFNQPIVPPILPFINRNNNKPISKKILVYLPFEDLNDIVELLKPFKDNSFYVYHDIEKPKTIGNINLKPFSRSGFEGDLLSSEKVLCNAGFELPSESLILGKNILLKPLIGQMEQLSNAEAMKRLNWGYVMNDLNPKIISEWIDQPPSNPVSYPDTAQSIVEWINSKSFNNIDKLSLNLWKQVSGREI